MSKSIILCYLLSAFIAGLYGYFIYAEGSRVVDYVFQNFSTESEYRLVADLDSKTGYHYTDSLTNIKSGEVLPVRYEKMRTGFMALDVQRIPLWVRAVGCLSGMLLFAYVVYSIGLTRNFLRNVRERRVFTFENVRLLHRLGLVLVGVWFFSFLFAYMDYWGTSSLIDFENYRLEFNGISSLLYLMAGAFSLLGAEVFHIGLKMKEEQELTI
ncbi:DUF2975 domain-containing protein [Bacteroides helcogenes]|uniref:Transmembrane protein n=2 Tax=Bacteroides helcogenes TaxID=290053 RepID=E6SQL4_BACT6|nr:DUF2975 domain-containing protein [Bacteroides helcogenes]ADV42988.1 putative transmembrane protein [Bacteroides helcogenes P 36-108]MDY5236969.1 DUF2975 domain-containing protein [Bacteroides helcogenes]